MRLAKVALPGYGVRGSHIFHTPQAPRPAQLVCRAKQDDNEPAADVGLGLKSVWMGAEALGNIVGATKRTDGSAATQPAVQAKATYSREEAIESLKQDYDVNYFVSGAGDMSAYDPNCRFADPFASFTGVDRFKRNVGNLGGMLRDIKLDITEWKEEENAVVTKWKFSAILDLPWKPRLAAAGGTRHVFDPATQKVIEHRESWDVDPSAVVRSLLKPSAKIPTSQWDVLMNSVYDGDVKGILLASNGAVVVVSGGLVGLSAAAKLVVGEGLPGTWIFVAVLIGALILEGLKIAGGMQGGETGTGGRF